MVKCKDCFLFQKKKSFCSRRKIYLSGGRKRNCEFFAEIPKEMRKPEPDRNVYRGWWQQKLRKKEIKEFESKEHRGFFPPPVQEEGIRHESVVKFSEEDLKPVLSEENYEVSEKESESLV